MGFFSLQRMLESRDSTAHANLKSSSRTWPPSLRLPGISRFAVEGFGGVAGVAWNEPVCVAWALKQCVSAVKSCRMLVQPVSVAFSSLLWLPVRVCLNP